MDSQTISSVYILTVADSRSMIVFSKIDAALYVEVNTFQLNNCYMPIVYDDTSLSPSDVPGESNQGYVRHEQRISDIISALESIPPFRSDLLEISRAKSLAWAHHHLKFLRQFKDLSWKIHMAAQEQRALAKKAEVLAKETKQLNYPALFAVFFQWFALGVLGIVVVGVAVCVGGTGVI